MPPFYLPIAGGNGDNVQKSAFLLVKEMNDLLAEVDITSDSLERLEEKRGFDLGDKTIEEVKLLKKKEQGLHRVIDTGLSFVSVMESLHRRTEEELVKRESTESEDEAEDADSAKSMEAGSSEDEGPFYGDININELEFLRERINTRLRFLKLNAKDRIDSLEDIKEERKSLEKIVKDKVIDFLDAIDEHSFGRHKIDGVHYDGDVKRTGKQLERAIMLYFDSCVSKSEEDCGEKRLQAVIHNSTEEHTGWLKAKRRYDNFIHLRKPLKKDLIETIAVFLKKYAGQDVGEEDIEMVLNDQDGLMEFALLIEEALETNTKKPV